MNKKEKIAIQKHFDSVFYAKPEDDPILKNPLIKKVMQELSKT